MRVFRHCEETRDRARLLSISVRSHLARLVEKPHIMNCEGEQDTHGETAEGVRVMHAIVHGR